MGAASLALIKGKDIDPQGPDAADRADILLITAGEVWDVAKVVEAARRSGHRVFAIGVGSAPAEAVLTQLAESTGGACEFATPGEVFGADQPALNAASLFGSAEDGPSHELVNVAVEVAITGDSLARIAAARRLASLDPSAAWKWPWPTGWAVGRLHPLHPGALPP